MASSEKPRIRLGSPLPPLVSYNPQLYEDELSERPKKRRSSLLHNAAKSVTASSLLAAFSPRRTSYSLTQERRLPKKDLPSPMSEVEESRRPSPISTAVISTPKLKASVFMDGIDSITPLTGLSDEESQPPRKKARFTFANGAGGSNVTVVGETSQDHRRSSRLHISNQLSGQKPTYDFRRQSTKRSIQPQKTNSVIHQTSRGQIREAIISETLVRQDSFLRRHKEYFLPLLPSKNYVAKLDEALSLNGEVHDDVTFSLLKQQPHGVQAVLKDYQMTGLSFLIWLHKNGTSGILGDEMGLGKTLQTLSLFQYLEEAQGTTQSMGELRPYLVVCPLSVVGSWVSEARKWTPDLKILRFHGSRHERAHLKKVATGAVDRYGNASLLATGKKGRKPVTGASFTGLADEGPFKIVVTSYETFASEPAWFKSAFAWKYVVLDEGHKIKNDTTQISTALQGLRAEHRLILTGTPLQNNMLEMWALLHWLYPMVFTAATADLFKTSFDLAKGSIRTNVLDDTRRLLELICMRRKKDSSSVNLGLPSKTEILLYVPLTPYQRLWYTRLLTKSDDAMLSDLFRDSGKKEQALLATENSQSTTEDASVIHEPHSETLGSGQWEAARAVFQGAIEYEGKDGSSKNLYQRLMNLVLQLRKVCSHPYLIPHAVPEPYTLGDHVVLASGKFLMLQKLIQELVLKKKKKVLIFSGFTGNLNLTEELLDLLGGGSSFKYTRFDGSTPRARRNLAIRLFNNSPEYQVMLISTRAGGLGINLASATEVIFIDEDWNPQVTLQAEARAHRIGQNQPVTIYKLCTQGTVEEQMLGRIRKKLYLSTKVTESMQNVHGQMETSFKRGRQPEEQMPQLDNTTLKSLIRRGAQTLVHPSIDAREMLAWDFNTMIEKCRDKPASMDVDQDDGTAGSEEDWLRMMERVECAVFEGKQHARQKTTTNEMLPDDVTRADRRIGKNTTVMIDGFAINKESMLCADWEAVPTLAGKDPRLAEPLREKKPEVNNQDYCQVCFDGGKLTCCQRCPRSYHEECMDEFTKARLKGKSLVFCCSQHNCYDCRKNTGDAGGMLYRCRWCEKSWCEDCLGTEDVELIGESLLEYETLGYGQHTNAFYICCSLCCQQQRSDASFAKLVQEMLSLFQKNHRRAIRAAPSTALTSYKPFGLEAQTKSQKAPKNQVQAESGKSSANPVVPMLSSAPHAASGNGLTGLDPDAYIQQRKKRPFGFL